MSMEFIEKESLKQHTWWQTGGLAEYFCQPESELDLKSALLWATNHKKQYTVLGAGTNVLISDKGISGLVISTKKMKSYSVKKEKESLFISCEAGVLKSEVMKIFKQNKLAPAIFLSGLPGDVAGGVVMNAGVGKHLKPHEFSSIVHSIQTVSQEGVQTFLKQELKWSYRKTSGWGSAIISKVNFEWPLKEEEDLNFYIKQELKKRRASQPLNYASCGSVFKNPFPKYAGQLIEQAGLKGRKEGAAQISEKHANFIVNLGGASSTDIHKLIKLAQQKVKKLFQIELELEAHYLGDWSQV